MKAVVRTCSCAISLDHLDFRLLCMAHIVEIRMNLLSVSFQNGSSYLCWKLLEFWAYANSLDHLDCSLAAFYNKISISGIKFLSQSIMAVVRTCECTISLGHFDFRMYMFGSHSRNQDEFTLSFIRDGSSSSYFSRKLFEFRAFANSLDHLDCSLAVFSNIFFFVSGREILSQQ